MQTESVNTTLTESQIDFRVRQRNLTAYGTTRINLT